jgi:hypothetical protein
MKYDPREYPIPPLNNNLDMMHNPLQIGGLQIPNDQSHEKRRKTFSLHGSLVYTTATHFDKATVAFVFVEGDNPGLLFRHY